MDKKSRIFKIGIPGKIDPIFGLIEYQSGLLMEPLYTVVYKDTGDQVSGIGSFFDPISAENYVKEHRDKLIEKNFQELFLIN